MKRCGAFQQLLVDYRHLSNHSGHPADLIILTLDYNAGMEQGVGIKFITDK